MMTYLARKPISRLFQAALIPVILITLLAASYGIFRSAEQEGSSPHIQRYEHKLTQPLRIHPPKLSYLSGARTSQHGFTPLMTQEPAAAFLCVSLYPFIYIILKRRWFRPLKFTSNYVDTKRKTPPVPDNK